MNRSSTKRAAWCADFSELLDVVTKSLDNDKVIDAKEADEIRQKWEDLKACVERVCRIVREGAISTSEKVSVGNGNT